MAKCKTLDDAFIYRIKQSINALLERDTVILNDIGRKFGDKNFIAHVKSSHRKEMSQVSGYWGSGVSNYGNDFIKKTGDFTKAKIAFETNIKDIYKSLEDPDKNDYETLVKIDKLLVKTLKNLHSNFSPTPVSQLIDNYPYEDDYIITNNDTYRKNDFMDFLEAVNRFALLANPMGMSLFMSKIILEEAKAFINADYETLFIYIKPFIDDEDYRKHIQRYSEDHPWGYAQYKLGIASGLIPGILKGLWDTIVGLWDLLVMVIKMKWYYEKMQIEFLITHISNPIEALQKDIKFLQDTAGIITKITKAVNDNPGVVVEIFQMGFQIARDAIKKHITNWTQKGTFDQGFAVGLIVGAILFEIIIEIIGTKGLSKLGKVAKAKKAMALMDKLFDILRRLQLDELVDIIKRVLKIYDKVDEFGAERKVIHSSEILRNKIPDSGNKIRNLDELEEMARKQAGKLEKPKGNMEDAVSLSIDKDDPPRINKKNNDEVNKKIQQLFDTDETLKLSKVEQEKFLKTLMHAEDPYTRGMLKKHHDKLLEFTKDNDIFIILRDSNEETVNITKFWKKRAKYAAKPMECKPKTIRAEDLKWYEDNAPDLYKMMKKDQAGLSAFHPPDFPGPRGEKTRKVLDNMSVDDLPDSFKVDHPDEDWNKLLKEMKYDEKYKLFKENMKKYKLNIDDSDNYIVKGVNEDTGNVIEGFYADYDAHGVYTSRGDMIIEDQVKDYFKEINTDYFQVDMFQHAGQDTYKFAYKLGIDPPVTVYSPSGKAYALKTKGEMIEFYKKILGQNLENIYKKPK